jgi:hypothetical protein
MPPDCMIQGNMTNYAASMTKVALALILFMASRAMIL